jgi:hypothetical protein
MLRHSTFITDLAAATQGCDKPIRLSVFRSISQIPISANFVRIMRD